MTAASCGRSEPPKATGQSQAAPSPAPPARAPAPPAIGGDLMTQPPPRALDAYYPPATQGNLYQDQMLDMYRAAAFARRESMRGNWERARKSWAQFIERLAKVRKEVPEWESQFGTMEDWDEVTRMYRDGKTKEDAWAADKRIGELRLDRCEKCHLTERLRVTARYHYPTFYKISVPLLPAERAAFLREAGEDLGEYVSLRGYMRSMNTQSLDVLTSVEWGEVAQAKKALGRLVALVEREDILCKTCHGLEERRHYVDKDTIDRFRKLGDLLAREQVDAAAFRAAWDDANARACRRCHDVHLPVAKMQRGWALALGEQAPGQ